jgi:hypothetical protein
MVEEAGKDAITERIASDLINLDVLSDDDIGKLVDIVISLFTNSTNYDFQSELNSFAEHAPRYLGLPDNLAYFRC